MLVWTYRASESRKSLEKQTSGLWLSTAIFKLGYANNTLTQYQQPLGGLSTEDETQQAPWSDFENMTISIGDKLMVDDLPAVR